MLEINGYSDLQQLHVSKRTHVFRAKRDKDNQSVILKKLTADYPSVKNILRYRHEFEILQKISSAAVIKAYGLEKALGSYILVLEDFGGDDLNKVFPEKVRLDVFLPIAIKLAQALADIHASDIVHKDINPSNIIYNQNTDEIRIIDFELSTTLDAETPLPVNPNILAGTPTYMSPEQTGRMNRKIDYRSDYYSLGVTFYKLLTGKLPFYSADTMELVYCHIAKQCASVHEIEPSVNESVSQIISKLMAKNAEDRYQSAQGIISDLQECQKQHEQKGKIEPFELAKNDFSWKFKLPQKLYGREKEVDRLLQVFAKAAGGSTQLVMVKGYSGVGKTSLVREVQKPITEKRGNFCSGKFDQLQKSIPYSALIQSMSVFVEYLLKEDADALAEWNVKINKAIGVYGQVLVDVIPNLSLIIGPQPPVREVSAAEAKIRFNMVFSLFIKAVCQPNHPFVLFLDDLQWIDSASLNLFTILLTNNSIQNLLVIGAYRENEIDNLHPLIAAKKGWKEFGVTINEIALDDLSLENAAELTADALNTDKKSSQPLAKLVYEKTNGNAFYLTQLLKSLAKEDLIRYSIENKCWEWDVEKIGNKDITDNVASLMVRKIEQLSEKAQYIIKMAACIGHTFTIHILSLISEEEHSKTMVYLWEAIREELIFSAGTDVQETEATEEFADIYKMSFKFAHDRIQQAAYHLIPVDKRKSIHLKVGRLLSNSLADNEIEDEIFSIVNHLNQGKKLVKSEDEIIHIIELNIRAGRKAKNSAAYDSAINFFREAFSISKSDNWTKHHQMFFELHLERAECEFFIGNFSEADVLLRQALNHAETAVERGKVYIQLIAQSSIQGKYIDSIHTGIKAFECFDIKLPPLEDKGTITNYIKEQEEWYNRHWGDRPIAELYDLPITDDPAQEILKIISVNLFDCCVISSPFYLPVLSFVSVNLSIEHGNTANSAYAYVGHGMVMSSSYQDYTAAYEFGLLGKRITEEKLENERAACKTMNVFWGFLSHLKTHVNLVPPMMEKAYQTGLNGGDFVHASYCLVNGHRSLISMGMSLVEAEQKTKEYLDNFKRINADVMHDLCCASSGAFIKYMRGKTLSDASFDTEDFSASQFLDAFSVLKLFLVFADIYRMFGFYVMNQDEHAFNVANQFQINVSFADNYIHGEEFRFYSSLIYLRMYHFLSGKDKKKYLAKVKENYEFIKKIAINAPINFENHEYLVAAEIARVEGRDMDAINFYDKAIKSASKYEHVPYEAVANECMARFWFEHDKEEIAETYLRKSYYAYKLWGADRKVEQIEQDYLYLILPKVLVDKTSESSHQSVDSTMLTKFYNLTSESVLKVSQAISKEITLDGFLKNMMDILIENSGAQKCVLLLERDGEFMVEAEGSSDKSKTEVMQSIPLNEVNKNGHCGLPISVINFVVRTQKDIILSDASIDDEFSNDEYIRQSRPHSLLCHPVVHHNNVMGVLYFENSVTKGVFGEHHLEFLKMLSSQVAISIENALIYQHLEDLVDKRTHDLVEAQEQLVQSGKMAALGGLVSGIAHEINTPLGNSITSTSLLSVITDQAMKKFNKGELKETDLRQYLLKSSKTIGFVAEALAKVDMLILRFKQIAVDQSEEKHRLFDLKSHLEEIIGRAKLMLEMEMFDFHLECDKPIVIDSYPSVFYQIIVELLSNTLLHAYENKSSGEVYIKVSQEGEQVKIIYSDKGRGIPQENIAMVFDPFYTSNRSKGSAGLGLYILYILVVKQLSGAIECTSSAENGTCFTICFKGVNSNLS